MERITNEIQVLVVAENLLTRAGLAALLESEPEITIIGQADMPSAPEQALLLEPDVMVCEAGWQADTRLDMLTEITQTGVPVLVLLPDDTHAMALLRLLNSLDSYGVLLNDRDSHALLLALKTVAGGLVALDPVLLSAGLLPVQPLDSALPTDDLTPREDDVLQLLAQGLTNKAIAHRLGITDHTVKFHVTAIISKFQAQSRTDAVVRATRAGLVIL